MAARSSGKKTSPRAGEAARGDLRTVRLLDLDRGRLRGLDPGLRNMNRQHAVLRLGADRLVVDGIGKREAAREIAIEALDLMELLVLLLLPLRPLAAQGEHSILVHHLGVFFLDARKRCANQVLG